MQVTFFFTRSFCDGSPFCKSSCCVPWNRWACRRVSPSMPHCDVSSLPAGSVRGGPLYLPGDLLRPENRRTDRLWHTYVWGHSQEISIQMHLDSPISWQPLSGPCLRWILDLRWFKNTTPEYFSAVLIDNQLSDLTIIIIWIEHFVNHLPNNTCCE